MAKKHTPEPWPERTVPKMGKNFDPEQALIPLSLTDYGRARACVNALDGWDDPSAAGELLRAVCAAITKAKGKIDG